MGEKLPRTVSIAEKIIAYGVIDHKNLRRPASRVFVFFKLIGKLGRRSCFVAIVLDQYPAGSFSLAAISLDMIDSGCCCPAMMLFRMAKG